MKTLFNSLCILAVTFVAAARPVDAKDLGTTEIRPSDMPAATPDSPEAVFNEFKIQTRDAIELWDERVHKKLLKAAALVKDLDLRRIDAQKIATDELIEILAELDGEAKSIIDAHAAVIPDLKLFKAALEQAPKVFERIATDFEARAAEKKSSALKEIYADFADAARALSNTYKRRASGVDDMQVQLSRRLEFVRESRDCIADIRGLLAAIPISAGEQTEKLVDRVNRYIDSFNEAIQQIKAVANRISEESSPDHASPPKPGSPGSKSPGSANATVPGGSLRDRLAALKR